MTPSPHPPSFLPRRRGRLDRGNAYPISWISTGVTGTTTLALSPRQRSRLDDPYHYFGDQWHLPSDGDHAPHPQALVKVSAGSRSINPRQSLPALRDPPDRPSVPGRRGAVAISSNPSSPGPPPTSMAQPWPYSGATAVDFTGTLTAAVDASSGSLNWTVHPAPAPSTPKFTRWKRTARTARLISSPSPRRTPTAVRLS